MGSWEAVTNPAYSTLTIASGIIPGDDSEYVCYVVTTGSTAYLYRYNCLSDIWTPLSNHGNLIYSLCVSPDHSKLASSRKNGGGPVNGISFYDIATDTWSYIPFPTVTIHSVVSNPQPGALIWYDNDTIFVIVQGFGGGSDVYKKILKYTISTDTWFEYTDEMYDNTGQIPTTLTYTSDRAYIVGVSSWFGTARVYRWEIATDTWAAIGNITGYTTANIVRCDDPHARIWLNKTAGLMTYLDCDNLISVETFPFDANNGYNLEGTLSVDDDTEDGVILRAMGRWDEVGQDFSKYSEAGWRVTSVRGDPHVDQIMRRRVDRVLPWSY